MSRTPNVDSLGKLAVLLLMIALSSIACGGNKSAANPVTITISANDNVQAAMDQLKAAGGGRLILQAGTYNVTTGIKVYNNCTIEGASEIDRPVITMAAGVDEPVVTNASIPFTNVGAKNLIVNGGLTEAEQAYPEYFHSGSDEYKARINAKEESQADLDARIKAARLNLLGIDFSDKHNEVSNTGANIENCLVQRCSMGINVGRTTGVTIKNTRVEYCGAIKKYYHGLYLSIVDQVELDGLEASNNLTGIGCKLTDFYGDKSETNKIETSIRVKNCKFNSNYDRGMAAYHFNHLYVENNEANGNQKTGINILYCADGTLKNNRCHNNPLDANRSYDIWLNNCANFTISANSYDSKAGF